MSFRRTIPRHKVFGSGGPSPGVPVILIGTPWNTGEIWRSLDDGLVWAQVYVGSTQEFARNPSTKTLIATGYNGALDESIFRSTDNGETWTEVWTNLTGGSDIKAACYNAAGGYFMAVVYTGAVLRSADDGLTWATVGNRASLNKIVVADDDNIVGVGNLNGWVVRTTDDGVTWNLMQQINPGDVGWNLCVAQNSNVIAAYEDVDMWYSTDHGVTWTHATVPARDTMLGVGVCTDGTILAGRDQGDVWASTDHGVNYSLRSSFPVNYFGNEFIATPTGEVVGAAPDVLASGVRLYRSTDVGVTWNLEQTIVNEAECWAVISFSGNVTNL